MTNKDRYKALCETEGDNIPLFLQYWWMETVCHGKQWDVALVAQQDGQIEAAMPYLIGRKFGLRYVLQPQLTQYNGPWFKDGADIEVNSTQIAKQIQSLHLALFNQNFAPSTPLSLCWKRFHPSERITYRIDDISQPQEVFNRFAKSSRQRKIRQAEKELHPCDITPHEFAIMHQQYWQSRGEQDLLTTDFMERVITRSLERKQGILLAVSDTAEKIHAARFVAFDSRCAYALLSALNPEGHHNGASPLLFWHIIQQLSGRCKSFDFEGSMVPSIAQSYQLYGATPTTYYQMFKSPIPFVRQLLHIE